MKKIKIKSAYMTRFGRLEEDYVSLALDAARAIFDVCDPRQVSAVYLSSFAPGPLCGIRDLRETISRTFAKEFPSLTARYHGPFKTGGEAANYGDAISGIKSGNLGILQLLLKQLNP